jgi:hypothetical protein
MERKNVKRKIFISHLLKKGFPSNDVAEPGKALGYDKN